MSKNEMIMLPREVVERALDALARGCPPDCKDGMTDSGGVHPWGEAALIECPSCQAVEALRAALDRLQAEQDPTPDGATHIQLQQGAFYKRVDGKWYVWSLMKNGEPHRWYISPGTAESCLEPLATTPKQKREPLTNERIKAGLIHLIEYTDARERCAFNIGVRFAERAHGIK